METGKRTFNPRNDYMWQMKLDLRISILNVTEQDLCLDISVGTWQIIDNIFRWI